MLKEDKIKRSYYKSKRHQCVCSKLYEVMYHDDKQCPTGLLNKKHDTNSKKVETNHLKDEGTQIELKVKDIYDAYVLEGLLNTNNDINKSYVDINKINSVINDMEALSDIKRILQVTNDKLDLILKALLEKKEDFSNRSLKDVNKHNPNKHVKHRTKCERSKSVSNLATSDNNKQNAMIASLNYSQQEINSAKSKYQLKEYSTSNPFFIPSYNTLFNVYSPAYAHFNYYKGFGSMCSDLEVINNYYNPFIMLSNFKPRKFQMGSGHKVHEISNINSDTNFLSNPEENEDYFADQE